MFMPVGTFGPRLARLAATLGVLIGLAGCTTNPVSVPPAPEQLVSVPRVSLPAMPVASAKSPAFVPLQLAPLPVDPELVSSPVDTPPAVDLIRGSEPRPALLGGEAAREFERGGASWYGTGFHGRRTASGERFDMHALTAAHRTLPFGTLVRVHSLVNGRDVDVRITDRGPFSRSRVIDVSRAAAEELGMLGAGFKEVVLLVPESTEPVAEAWPVVVKKRRQYVKRSPPLARR